MLSDAVLFRAQIQQQGESNFANKWTFIWISWKFPSLLYCFSKWISEHLCLWGPPLLVETTSRYQPWRRVYLDETGVEFQLNFPKIRTFKKIFFERCVLALPLYRKLCKFSRFIDVDHCVVWDIIDFVVEVIIPFIDVDFCGMPIFDILIYSLDIFHFKVYLSIEFFL